MWEGGGLGGRSATNVTWKPFNTNTTTHTHVTYTYNILSKLWFPLIFKFINFGIENFLNKRENIPQILFPSTVYFPNPSFEHLYLSQKARKSINFLFFQTAYFGNGSFSFLSYGFFSQHRIHCLLLHHTFQVMFSQYMRECIPYLVFPYNILSKLIFCTQQVSPIAEERMENTATYHIKDYKSVLNIVKDIPGVVLNQLPQSTLSIVQKMTRMNYSHQQWTPFMPIHVSDIVVDELMQQVPSKLKSVLLPFQVEGVKYGLRRGGRCLIADEMGVGKTIQV